MISRVFSVLVAQQQDDGNVQDLPDENEFYKGFDQKVEGAEYIAIVKSDDVYEVYALDNNGPAVAELQRYIGTEPYNKIVGVYATIVYHV